MQYISSETYFWQKASSCPIGLGNLSFQTLSTLSKHDQKGPLKAATKAKKKEAKKAAKTKVKKEKSDSPLDEMSLDALLQSPKFQEEMDQRIQMALQKTHTV